MPDLGVIDFFIQRWSRVYLIVSHCNYPQAADVVICRNERDSQVWTCCPSYALRHTLTVTMKWYDKDAALAK